MNYLVTYSFCIIPSKSFSPLPIDSPFNSPLDPIKVPAGIPELTRDKDIDYLINMLELDKTEKEASVHFEKEIASCLSDTIRRLDNLVHNLKHGAY